MVVVIARPAWFLTSARRCSVRPSPENVDTVKKPTKANCSFEHHDSSANLSPVPSEKIIQLHQILAQRGYAVHSWAEEMEEVLVEVPAIQGRLVHGELVELWPKSEIGAGLAVREVMRAAVESGHFFALVDGCDGFDPAGAQSSVLKRMLWVRTRTAEQAIKAADLLLRDGNLPLVVLYVRGLPLASLRKVPSQHWYRLQRLAKETGTACLIVTPAPMVPCARKRWAISGQFDLDDLERDAAEVLPRLHAEIQRRQGGGQMPFEAAAG
jgi:hypothetical protein